MPEIIFRYSDPPSEEDYKQLAESLARLQVFVAPSADKVGKLVPLVEVETIFPGVGNNDFASEITERGEFAELTVNYSQHATTAAVFWLDIYTNGTCRYWETIDEKDMPEQRGNWADGIQAMLDYLGKFVPPQGKEQLIAIAEAIQSRLPPPDSPASEKGGAL